MARIILIGQRPIYFRPQQYGLRDREAKGLAALRLMTNSRFEGCSTAALAPVAASLRRFNRQPNSARSAGVSGR
jgi:hypothetical protein